MLAESTVESAIERIMKSECSPDDSERREEQRHPLTRPVSVITTEGITVPAISAEIGGQGIRIIHREPIESKEGTLILHRHPSAVAFRSEVRWTKKWGRDWLVSGVKLLWVMSEEI